MDDRPEGLTATPPGAEPREPPPGPERKGPRHRPSHLLPLGLGVLLAAAAIAAALILLRGDGSEAAPAPAAPTAPPAQPVLRIVFPEGFTRREMAQRIEAVNEIAAKKRGITPSLSPRAYLRATAPSKLDAKREDLPAGFRSDEKVESFEGFLFPATYDFTEDTKSAQLADLQLKAFRRAWSKLDLSFARAKKLTPYDVLIIASMIEGEVAVPRERALVAAVIYNRLRAGMKLEIDATLRYGLDIPPNRAIRQSELRNPTPYNTRIHAGLPPTPINNPGLASMRAAARPADVDYLYFVRKKDCRSHFFTASEKAFLKRLEQPRC